MDILMITPHHAPIVCGNSTDVERIAEGLSAQGHRVKVIAPGEEAVGRYDVIHAFHATKSGAALRRWKGVPYIVTMTGTDYNHDLLDPEKVKEIEKLLGSAKAVTFLNEEAMERTGRVAPMIKGKSFTVPRGESALPRSTTDYRREWNAGDAIIFTMVGGLRDVKNNLYPIPLLAQLARSEEFRTKGMRYIMVGPVLDRSMLARLTALKKRFPFASYEGCVPHAEMEGVYRATDIIVNTSLSEGDSNAIAEAKMLGKPILASDIPGNAQGITDGKDGLLFSGDRGFLEKAKMLLDPGMRKKLGEGAKKSFRPNPQEIKMYLELYRMQ